MNWPIFLMELLKLIVPALIVFLTAYFVLNSYLENDYQKRLLEMRMNNQGAVTPLRLQAYERLTLFVERISLQSIIMRTINAQARSGACGARVLQHPTTVDRQL